MEKRTLKPGSSAPEHRRKFHVLRWSFMLFMLSLVEGTLGRSNAAAGSLVIAKISLVLAITLFVIFHRVHKM